MDQELSIQSTASVATTGALRGKLAGRVLNFKEYLRPDVPPDTWRLHFTDLWSNSGVFEESRLSLPDKWHFVDQVCNFLRSARPELLTVQVNSILVLREPTRKELLKHQRESDYARTLMASLQLRANP